MDHAAPIAQFTVPIGGQRIEMNQVDHEAGGLSMLRVHIREGRRFTVFDIDPGTAVAWGEALRSWGRARSGGTP